MKLLSILLTGLLFFHGSAQAQKKLNKPFAYERFIIKKGQLGDIKIGMTITQAEEQLAGLVRTTGEAGSFGFDGGGPAYLYSNGDVIVLGLIPARDTDTLYAIVAVDKRLRTTNGLHPNASVKTLMDKYRGMKVYWDEMNSWEFFEDEKNGWSFIFMTSEKERIAVYKDPNLSSKPVHMAVKADWITIR